MHEAAGHEQHPVLRCQQNRMDGILLQGFSDPRWGGGVERRTADWVWTADPYRGRLDEPAISRTGWTQSDSSNVEERRWS
jgi:hypothetical protein